MCRDLLGVDPDALAGGSAPSVVHPDDLELLADALHAVPRRTARTGPSGTGCSDPDGAARTVESKVSNRLDDPVIRGIVVNTRDVTEAEVARPRARRERGGAADRGAVGAGGDLRGRPRWASIRLWNPACEALFGWTADEVIGRPVPFLSETAEAQRPRRAAPTSSRVATSPVPPRSRRRDGDADLGRVVRRAGHGPRRVRSPRSSRSRSTSPTACEPTATSSGAPSSTGSWRRCVGTWWRPAPESIDERAIDGLERLAAHFGARAAALYVRDLARPRFVWPVGADGRGRRRRRSRTTASSSHDDDDPRAGWVIAGAHGPLGMLVLAWDEPPEIGADDLAPLETVGRRAHRRGRPHRRRAGGARERAAASAPWPSTRPTSWS